VGYTNLKGTYIMQVCESARSFVEANIHHMQYITTIRRSDPPARRSKTSIAYGIDRRAKGIYFFYPKGCNPAIDPMRPIYIGETTNSVQSRLRNHKSSLIDPSWKVECTGKKFIAAGIDLDTEFDVYYIDAKLLNIDTRQESIFAETAFMVHLKPLVWK
jgi:hypothetical protein